MGRCQQCWAQPVTIVFTDLDGDIARRRAAGLEIGKVEAYGDVRIAKVADPDGNVPTLTEGPGE